MMYEQNTARTLYKKLLTFYPQGFKERLEESMQQTFNDLYNEQKQKPGQGLFGFMLWMFTETAMGITREHILLITEGNAMKNFFINLRSPAIISLLLVIPFMIMEVANRRNFNEGFPIPLFVIMWLLPVAFIIILMPVVRNVRTGNSIMANPVSLVLRVALLLLMAWMWGVLLVDQMPCFLGVPNCD